MLIVVFVDGSVLISELDVSVQSKFSAPCHATVLAIMIRGTVAEVAVSKQASESRN